MRYELRSNPPLLNDLVRNAPLTQRQRRYAQSLPLKSGNPPTRLAPLRIFSKFKPDSL
ncbi:MAG: hypothetical protein V7K57_24340 [Nostoc sp.]